MQKSASDSAFDCWRYINIWLALTLLKWNEAEAKHWFILQSLFGIEFCWLLHERDGSLWGKIWEERVDNCCQFSTRPGRDLQRSYAEEIVSISSAVWAQCTNVTDRETDHGTVTDMCGINAFNSFLDVYFFHFWRLHFWHTRRAVAYPGFQHGGVEAP